MIVFATNIRPGELVDEAFLRRIHYKIFAESPTQGGVHADLRELLPRTRSSSSGTSVVEWLLTHVFQAASDSAARLPPARSDRPGHVARRISGTSRAELSPELLEAACAAYFVDDREAAARRTRKTMPFAAMQCRRGLRSSFC